MIYILGGNGFVGSAFIRYFKKAGLKEIQDFYNITRKNYKDLKNTKCDLFINANGNSKRYIAEKDPLKDFDMNVTATFETTLDFISKKYIHLSTVDVYDSPSDHSSTNEHSFIDVEKLSNYGFSKYLAESIIKKRCSNYLIFRLGGMVGENLTKGPIFDIVNKNPLFVNPRSRYQFINTDDVAEIIMRTADKQNNEIYNLCGTGNIELAEVYEMLHTHLIHDEKPNPTVHEYDVSNEKLSSLFLIKTTKETIEEYLFG